MRPAYLEAEGQSATPEGLRSAIRAAIEGELGPPPKIRRVSPRPKRRPINHDLTDFRASTMQLAELSARADAAALADKVNPVLAEDYLDVSTRALDLVTAFILAMQTSGRDPSPFIPA